MKHVVYYFTGTGNNLVIAKSIQKELGDTDIFPIRVLQINRKIPEIYDWVIFSVPSYNSHIPPYVGECIKNVEFAQKQRVVSIAGCAGNRGKAIEDLREAVMVAGKTPQLEYMIMQPGSYILSYGAFPRAFRKTEYTVAKQKIKKIAKDIRANRTKTQKKPGMFYKEKNEVHFQEAMSQYAKKAKEYTVSEDCILCKSCVNVCPVNNIVIENGEIHFLDHCQQCMGCIQWCPKNAISHQEIAKGRKRYHHDEISLTELIQENRKLEEV